jgi:hypothetical protein
MRAAPPTRYVELVNAVDLEGRAALFSPDATLLHCVCEMEARAGGKAVAHAIDRVTVDADAITGLAIYFR